MRVYICSNHDSHWPVGVASIVVAQDRGHARRVLDKQLRERGLMASDQEPYELVELDLARAGAVVVCDGDY